MLLYQVFPTSLIFFRKFFGTGGEIRTPINGFGDRYATIAPHPCVFFLVAGPGLEPGTSAYETDEIAFSTPPAIYFSSI